jgi:hypothetical protein
VLDSLRLSCGIHSLCSVPYQLAPTGTLFPKNHLVCNTSRIYTRRQRHYNLHFGSKCIFACGGFWTSYSNRPTGQPKSESKDEKKEEEEEKEEKPEEEEEKKPEKKEKSKKRRSKGTTWRW